MGPAKKSKWGSADGTRARRPRRSKPTKDPTAVDIAFGPSTTGAGVGGFTVETRDGEWSCAGILEAVDGQLVLRELLIRPAGPSTAHLGITGDVLRGLPLGRWLAECYSELVQLPEAYETGIWPSGVPVAPDRAAAARMRRALAELRDTKGSHRGSRGYGRDFYRQVALAYLDLQKEGYARGILVAIAEQYTRELGRYVARETARDWVRKATELEFLTPGTPGRAGRGPGARLYEEDEG